jgi:two-component system, sensor histidine kinase FlrB
MPTCLPEPPTLHLGAISAGSREDGEKFLLQAFRSFAEAADSLERCYGRLRSEVARLRGELEQSNAGLERSLEENRRMRRHLDRILDAIPCGVLVVGEDGNISLVNPEARRLLAGDLGNRPPCPMRVPEALHGLLQRARSEAGEQEQSFQDGSGREQWLAVRHAAVADGDSAGDGRVSVFILRDIGDAKRLMEERDKLRREQALAEMSAVLAHEIRNPLGSLELFAGLLAGAGLAEQPSGWVEQIQAGLRTLAATVNNVLQFHSLPAPARTPLDLGQLLDWAGNFLLPLARQAQIQLCLRHRLHGTWCAADRHRLEQVLLNLVLNAVRAMPGGGWIKICGRRSGSAAQISIGDTGPGIAPENLQRIFAAGYSTRAGSPGLGLAVCRKILEQHGGSLCATNRTGGGAVFTLILPLENAMHLDKAGQNS